jgi:hypothetical protein
MTIGSEPIMSRQPTPAKRPLSKAQLEDLGDARLVLETALHNIQAAIRQPTDAEQALLSAVTMTEQALAVLQRIHSTRAS